MSTRAILVLGFAGACGGAPPAVTVPAPPSLTVDVPATTPVAVPARAMPATKIRTVEGITEYRLANGLQVLLFPDPTQSTVTVNITYLVGSRHEGHGETGMAHLLEHMLFKGTPRYRNVLALLDARGAEANGTTWTDRTNYYETLPASAENLAFALDLEADRMIHASISAADLATEFSVVRNELEMGENDPLAVLETRIVSAAYLWHNYGKDTIGARSDVERVRAPALRAFYETYYQPDNAVLVVSGRFDAAGALAEIEHRFGGIARPTRVLPAADTVEPVQDGERSVTLRRSGELHAIGVAYHTVGAASPDYPAVQAALDVLDREPSGRLYKRLVEPGLAASVSADQARFRDPYLAVVLAEIRDGKTVERAERALIAEIEKLGASKIADRELARWRAATLKQLELAMADSQQLAIELSEFAALGDWRALFAYRARVQQVTTADVVRVAKTYFKASNRTTGRFVPTRDADRAPLTERPDIAQLVAGIERGPATDPGEAFAATLPNIEARTQRVVLAGGIKAALLPKKTRGGKVRLQLHLRWGDAASLRGKQAIAQLTAALLARGTTTKTYQDLRDLENQLVSEIAIEGDAQGFTLHIETLRAHLPAALDLGAEMLRAPSFPARQLALIQQEQLAALEQQLQDPSAIAWSTLAQLTSPWPKADPRHTPSAREQITAIQQVTLAQIKAFHREFVGASQGELAVVGDFDPAAIRAQVERRFGGWPSRRPYQRLDDQVFAVPGAARSIALPDKEMTQLVAMHDVAMRDTDPDYPAWLLAGHLLGGDTSSRIWTRLREKDGLSYGAGAWTDAGALDAAGSVGVYAIVAPQNLAQARAALLEEIARLTIGTITDAELRRAKQGWIQAQDTRLSSDAHVTEMLAVQTYHGRTTETARQLRTRLMAVTAADVTRVAAKHLQPARLVIVDAGDTSKATPGAPAQPAR